MTSTDWYDRNAEALSNRYESLKFEEVHGWLLDLLPTIPHGFALDIGAGSGRDAAWLASQGFSVWAVEPSRRLREQGQLCHRNPAIRWLDDSLPGLSKVRAEEQRFDLILLSAVWMHIPPQERSESMGRLLDLLAPDGVLAVTIRIGPKEPERQLFHIDTEELRTQASTQGARIIHESRSPDSLNRPDIHWFEVAVKRR